MSAIVINNTAPAADNVNKVGNLQKDDKGYYLVNLGGFNIFNRKNEFYRVTDMNKILNNKDSVFYKRLHEGYLIGEAEHPSMQPGMSNIDFYYRNLRLDLTNSAFHVRPDIETRPLNIPVKVPGAGQPVRVMGWIKPSGKHGAALQSMLDNPEQNVAFSIRCITANPKNIGGFIVKDVIEIITWDWVDIPGIFEANKWSTIAKESYGDLEINLEELIISTDVVNTIVSHERDDVMKLNNEIITKIYQTDKKLNVNRLKNW